MLEFLKAADVIQVSNSYSIRKKWPILCLRIPVLQSKQVVLIRSAPTYLRCIADQTRSKYDQPTLYRRPPTTLCPRSTYDLWRAGSSPTIFQPVEKLIPLTTTSQSGPDQPPLYFRPTYALPDQGPLIADPSIFPERERAGVDRVSGVNGPLHRKNVNILLLKGPFTPESRSTPALSRS